MMSDGDKTLIVRPAYGRDYKLASQVHDDWNANRDFVVCNSVGVYGRWRDSYVSRMTVETLDRELKPDRIEFWFSDSTRMWVMLFRKGGETE